MQDVLSLILGGGRGTRLYPLTKLRSKPAVPVAGKYRLIDIPISNCINSGLNRVYVLTQFLSVSLHRHIANTYKFDPFSQGFVEVLAAQQTYEAAGWYQGTADAVRQQIRYVVEDPCKEVLILSGDQLYRMDFRHLLATHRGAKADVTIAVLPVPRNQVEGFGIVRVDPNGKVVGFVEKPKTEEQLEPVKMSDEWLAQHGVHGTGRPYLASMGIYIFNRQSLLDLLAAKPLAIDFGKEVFPRSISSHHVQAHVFDGYWEDLGTVKAYHETSLALASNDPPFDFHSPEGVIYTRMRFLPASRVSAASVKECLISDGCIVQEGTSLERCIVGVRSRIGRNVAIRDTVLIGADEFENEQERRANRQLGLPDLGIGEGSVVERAIIDKDCRIGRNVRITNPRGLMEADTDQWVIREGIIAIPRGTVIPDGTVI
ncbi:MAG TPA: glucose-1-phosphate adenylyltransferase [Gemmataceae bacterium]|nr:glucose-1-phosphate adenylyltransferase [Gemmataceae bacterium]